MSDSTTNPKTGDADAALESDWKIVSDFLRENPSTIRHDADLLADLGLWVKADNIVEFGPAALARLSADKTQERAARRRLEATARSNFAAQAQTHAAVVELLETRNHADLARRVDEIARARFGLVAGVVALEASGGVPAGWRILAQGHADNLLGSRGQSHMGPPLDRAVLFGAESENVRSVAMVRLSLWEPARQGVLAFGSGDEAGFTAEMGPELVSFLARVVERTAERWPVL